MATLEIKVTHSRSGKVTRHDHYELDDELGRQLIAQLDRMIAELPGPVCIRHLTRLTDRSTVVDISIGPALPPTSDPSFQQQHQGGQSDDDR